MKENKLIAEFMGMEHCYRPYGDGFMEVKENGSCVELEDLQYHESWNWLMPVVEKIEQVHEGVPQELINLSLFSTIDEVYNAVVEFIKRYNEDNERFNKQRDRVMKDNMYRVMRDNKLIESFSTMIFY